MKRSPKGKLNFLNNQSLPAEENVEKIILPLLLVKEERLCLADYQKL